MFIFFLVRLMGTKILRVRHLALGPLTSIATYDCMLAYILRELAYIVRPRLNFVRKTLYGLGVQGIHVKLIHCGEGTLREFSPYMLRVNPSQLDLLNRFGVSATITHGVD